MTRREARKLLGTRSTRRAGTKSKAIPGMGNPGMPTPQTRYFRRRKDRPRETLRKLLKKENARPERLA